jgi:hypothetical protein
MQHGLCSRRTRSLSQTSTLLHTLRHAALPARTVPHLNAYHLLQKRVMPAPRHYPRAARRRRVYAAVPRARY